MDRSLSSEHITAKEVYLWTYFNYDDEHKYIHTEALEVDYDPDFSR